MKKVLALVLALVMVCTLAMAAATPDTFDLYAATSDNLNKGKLTATAQKDVNGEAITPVAAVTYDNGTGTLAYLAIGNDKYVKTTNPTVSDFAVTKAGKTDILYYVTAVTDVEYDATAKAFTNFGTGCGQVLNNTNSKYYELTNSADEGMVLKVADTDNGESVDKIVLVDGKLVKLTGTTDATEDHTWVVSGVGMKNGVAVPTEVSCAVCKAKATVYEAGKAPAGTDPVAVPGNYAGYVYVVPTAATTTTTTTNPDTGANDVIGVAAALAVVALVSGAAISLKK